MSADPLHALDATKPIVTIQSHLLKDMKAPSLNTIAPMSLELTDATGSGADVVRVAVRKLASA